MSALRDTAGSLGVLYYILFTLLICFIMVNVFLAVVFDALAHSKTTLVSRSDADERIRSWRRADDGSLDADAFGAGLRKGLLAVLAANFVLYFFIASGVAIVGKVVFNAAT